MIQEKENLKQLSDGFFFFSKIFYSEPTLSFVNSIVSSAKEGVWSFPFIEEQAKDAFSALGKLEYTEITPLILDYTSLFIGPKVMQAPPYASLYVDPKQEMFSQETQEVEKFYKSCGMQFSNANKEPSDHISLELMFLGFLFDQYNSHIKDKNKKEYMFLQDKINTFLSKHLLTWVPECLERIQKKAKTEFYCLLAVLTHDFLQQVTV